MLICVQVLLLRKMMENYILEYDMWIGFEAPVVNSWTYYLEGSFGYIFQPTGYTGYLIELDIEDRG